MHREEEAPQGPRPYAPQPQKTFFEDFETRSWTFYISVVDVVFFVLTIVVLVILHIMYVTDDMDETAKEPYGFDCVLYYFGAKHTPSIVYKYQFHRLIMPALLHGSPMHIIGNLVVQIYYGFVQEKYFGIKRVGLVYVLGALGGTLLSCVFFKYQISVGASAAIFALVGLELVYVIACFPNIEKKRLIVFFFIIPTLLLSFFEYEPNVDIAGHVGGFLVGVLLGIAFVFEDAKIHNAAYPNPPISRRATFSWAMYVITGIFLMTLFIMMYLIDVEDQAICPEA